MKTSNNVLFTVTLVAISLLDTVHPTGTVNSPRPHFEESLVLSLFTYFASCRKASFDKVCPHVACCLRLFVLFDMLVLFRLSWSFSVTEPHN
jgi:hypothetical protein